MLEREVAQKHAVERELADRDKRLAALESALGKVQDACADAENKCKERERELAELADSLRASDAARQVLSRQVLEARSALGEHEDALKELETKLSAARSHNIDQERIRKDLADQLAKAKEILQNQVEKEKSQNDEVLQIRAALSQNALEHDALERALREQKEALSAALETAKHHEAARIAAERALAEGSTSGDALGILASRLVAMQHGLLGVADGLRSFVKNERATLEPRLAALGELERTLLGYAGEAKSAPPGGAESAAVPPEAGARALFRIGEHLDINDMVEMVESLKPPQPSAAPSGTSETGAEPVAPGMLPLPSFSLSPGSIPPGSDEH